MTRRSRILAFGSMGALVLGGALCAVFVRGLTGELLTIVPISLGLGGALLLVFLEIGLGEERDLSREEARRRERERRRRGAWRRAWMRWPRRPS